MSIEHIYSYLFSKQNCIIKLFHINTFSYCYTRCLFHIFNRLLFFNEEIDGLFSYYYINFSFFYARSPPLLSLKSNSKEGATINDYI